MPIRIYALAKELKIDSKYLVDVCAKAGITGKGSALASLTEDEVEKVKAYLNRGKTERAAPKPAAAPVAVAAPARTSEPSGPPPAFTRDDYIAPGGVARKPRPLDQRPLARPAEPTESTAANRPEKGDRAKQRESREPIVKLAAIPRTEERPEDRKGEREPAAQKPIMTLPLEAIRGAKAGSSAPLEQFTKQQEKKRKEAEKDKEGARKSSRRTDKPPEATPPLLSKTGHRDRRKSRTAEEEEERVRTPGDRLAGMASARATRQQNRRRRGRAGTDEEGDDRPVGSATARRPGQARLTRRGANTAAPRKGKVTVELPCTVRSFSEATGVPTAQIQRTLMGLGTMVTINAQLDPDLAELLVAELGLDVEFKQPASLEDQLFQQFQTQDDDPSNLELRPPVVTFLGHVDHGKTSLLDRIIGTDVVSGEAGGITQHIRAYSVLKDGRRISFVDTPGHEAFTEMRARGANVTDIAVLVVAADDGVMPQTEEAISHAKAAGVPIVVAMNKIDLPGADPNKVFTGLSQHGLLPAEWGGDVEVVKTSAVTGEGIDQLLETLLLTAELHELKANPNRPAYGTCLEAQQDEDRGVIAKVIIKNGTLRIGDVVLCGAAYGRVKAMHDPLVPSRRLNEAGPSIPVNMTGLSAAPEAGDGLFVLPDISQARTLAEERSARRRSQALSGRSVRISFEEFQRRLEAGSLSGDAQTVTLNLILRADVRGSIEALEKELAKLDHPEVRLNLLQKSVGGITAADVTLAAASDAVIIGFNVIPDEEARSLAEERGVEIRRYDIIYKVSEDLKAMLEGKLKPEQHIRELGRALVQRVFTISRVGTVAGCRVLAGVIQRGCRIRVHREGRTIGDYPLDSLRREKDDVREVRDGFECGIKLAGFNDLKEGDILEAYKIEEVARTL